MATNRSRMHLTLVPVITMKVPTQPSMLGSANQVVVDATHSPSQCSRCDNDGDEIHHLCNISNAHHKYDEDVDMEFNKLIECIEAKISDDDDDDDEDREADAGGIFDGQSDCLVYPKMEKEEKDMFAGITLEPAMDCKVGNRFSPSEGQRAKAIEENTWKDNDCKTNIAYTTEPMLYHQEKIQWKKKSFYDRKADNNHEADLIQNETPALSQGQLFCLSSADNQVKCPVLKSSIVINNGLYKDDIKMANPESECNFNICGNLAATTLSSVTVNSVSTCSFSIKAITTHETSAAASSTAITKATSQYKNPADEKSPLASDKTSIYLAPLHSSSHECRHHLAPACTWTSLSSIDITNETNTTGNSHNASISDNRINDIITIQPDTLNPKNRFRKPVQQHELQIIVPTATNCNINNKVDNNYHGFSDIEDIGSPLHCPEKPVSYSSSISLFMSPSSLHVADKGTSGLAFTPFYCTLSPVVDTVPPTNQPSTSQISNNTRNTKNLSCPIQRKQAQVHFHGHMSHTLVPKVGQSQLPHALTVNKTTETFSRVDVKTATTTATTTTAIVFTESKKAQTDTATSTTTTATTTSVELCSKGYSLQGDCDNCRGGGDDDGCRGPTINYTPNTNCYFCNTSVTDLDKSTRLHENNNYYNFDDNKHIKEFQIPQEYQTQEAEEETMQKSSVDFYVENAWSSTDAILKERKSRVSVTQTSGWKEKMTSTEKMDNEGIKNKGNLSNFTLGNWEKLPTEADDNNNDECLWIECGKEDDSCPTLKEFELDNGRTTMTVISMKSNKKDEKESPVTSPIYYSQQTSQETALINENQSKIIFDIDESKLHKRKQDTKPRFEISPEKPQLMKIEREVKTLTNNSLGSKLVKDDWIKKMTNSNLTKKTEPKETNSVRQMTQAIESKLLRNNSFSNTVTDKVSQKTLTQSDAPQRCKPRRNKTFPQAQIRPQLFKFRSENFEQTQFTSHFDTIPARTNFDHTNEQLSNVFLERNKNESKDWKKQFPMKEFIIKTKEMGRTSDQNLNIIEVGEKFPAVDASMLKTSPISWPWKTSDLELSQTVSNDGHIASSEKFPKYLTEKCNYRPLSRVETGSSTEKDNDEPDASVLKKTTEIRVQLCPPKTSVRLKSPPSVNTVAPLHILPLSNAGEVYSKKECFGNETSREISDEENGRKHRMSKVDDNTSCLVADTIVGYVSKHNISDSRITRLAAREVSINPSKDDMNVASNSPRKPVFLSPLKDEECIAGKPLTLRCEVIGWPEPKVFWKFDGLSLDGQEHYVSEYNGRVAMLQLPDLLPSDEGTYSCVAQNKAGQVETNANLTVLGFAPDIYEPLESVKAQLGCTVCIQCRTKGNPPPKTSWKFNGQSLDSNRHVRFSNSGDLYMMEISHLKSEDVGCYEFRAVNPFGNSMCTGHILLEDPNVQKRKEPAAKCVIQPKESNILKPLSPKMPFSQTPDSFASINHSSDEKSQVQEPESETFPSSDKNKSQALNYKDSSEDILTQSKDQFESRDASRNRATISGITRMMNRAARELDSVFQEDSSEEELVSILKSRISPKSSSYLITTSPRQISRSSISTTAFTTKQILTTRSDFIQTTATMTSYDQIEDEDQLHEMMSKVENFEERKKIRARIREIREKKLKELEERRIENEKIANDALKEKVRRADEEKERKMQAYKEQSNITAVMEDRRLQASQDNLKERQSKANEDKRKKLEFYDQIAKKENEAKMLATGEDAKAEAKPAASASTPDSKSTSQKKSGDANKENIETKEAAHEIQQKIEQPSKDTKDDEIENLANADPDKAEDVNNSNIKNEEQISDKAEDKKMDEPEQIKEDLKEKSKEKDDENEITKKEEETVVKPEEKNEGTTEKLSEEGKDKEKPEAKNDDSTENVKDEKAVMEQTEEKKDDTLEKSKEGGESCEKTEDKKDGAVEKAKEDDDKPKETTETTTVTSKDGKTTTVTTVQTITDKNETRIITTEVVTKTMPDGGTSTKTSKRTKIIQNQMGFGGVMAAPGGLAPAGRGRGVTRSPSAIKQMLLEWAKAMTQEYSDKITITNFSSSWNNGIAFCALIHHFYPDAFDFDALDPKKRRHNFDLAFKTAEKMADIAPLLDTEDMMRMKNPDWKCVFTYVQSMYQKLRSHENNKAMPKPEKTAS